jgi:hypothetical protein
MTPRAARRLQQRRRMRESTIRSHDPHALTGRSFAGAPATVSGRARPSIADSLDFADLPAWAAIWLFIDLIQGAWTDSPDDADRRAP